LKHDRGTPHDGTNAQVIPILSALRHRIDTPLLSSGFSFASVAFLLEIEPMRKLLCFAFAGLLAADVQAAGAQTTLSVSYALPSNYKVAQEEIARRFEAEHPDIKIEFRSPLGTYDDVVSALLKATITGDVPDLAYVGANHVDLVAERGLAVPLDAFVRDTQEWSRLGYYPSILSLGTVSGRPFGVPFAISLPVLHVNEDLVRRAGGSLEAFPSTWEEIAELGRKIGALDSRLTGFTFQYDAWGNWLFQGLINSAGGRIEGERGCGIGFEAAEGQWALETLETFYRKGMPAMSQQQVQQAFAAGTIGIAAASASTIVRNERQIGKSFIYRTLPFPMKAADGKLPGGGTLLIITSKDPRKQKAAWEYVKFATGPEAQAIMVQNSGYLPVSERAVQDAQLLGGYFEKKPNQATPLSQMHLLRRWHVWPGPNGIKIFSVIQNHIDAVVTGKATAKETMPRLAADVKAMLPACQAGN
jgi:multiple sugar transport system substrate-binding protein